MLYPVDLSLDAFGYEHNEETDYILRLAQLVEDMDDEEFTCKQHFRDVIDNDNNEHFGRGNARMGYRKEYNRYEPSPVFDRLSVRPRVWNAFCPFTPSQFQTLSKECKPLWWLPRKGDGEPRAKKHGVEACLFSTIGMLKTGHSDLEMEAVAEMSHGLINMEFERMLTILDKVLEHEMQLLTDWEKVICSGAAKSHSGILYYLDGCDFPVRIGEKKHMYKTHEKNLKHQRAIRAQILIDS